MNLSIQTRAGVVEGGRANGVRHWLGVPYATAERFGPPRPPAPWTGSRAATEFGPQCPQSFGAAKKIQGRDVSEDCLVLNIWAPDSNDSAPKPVMVWIHGGAFMGGSGNLYDGAELAARGDIIVVTINYRLGILGFANLAEALDIPEIPSNLGVRDQVAALEWIRENIAAFGGDPARVTIAGESAGSICVSLLLHSRNVWPLFQQAIMQSGATSLVHSREVSVRLGQRFGELLGVKRSDADKLEKLKSLDVATLLSAQSKLHAAEPGAIPTGPWYDGDLLPSSLAEARTASTSNVPLLAGFNREEIRTFEIMRGPGILPMTRGANELLLRQQLPASSARIVLSAYTDTKSDARSLATHLTFGMPTLHFAERHSRVSPTWFYRFDYSHPFIGAAHAVELAFIWPFKGLVGALFRGGPLIGKRRALSERMQRHWVHFVRHGRPEGEWPAFSTKRRLVRLFNLEDRTADDPDSMRRLAWNGADVSTSLARS